jgi:hypothetical protein
MSRRLLPDMTETTFKGGCLCGALRWGADRAPDYMGLCCCADCRKASGSGFIGFMGFAAEALTITGPAPVPQPIVPGRRGDPQLVSDLRRPGVWR